MYSILCSYTLVMYAIWVLNRIKHFVLCNFYLFGIKTTMVKGIIQHIFIYIASNGICIQQKFMALVEDLNGRGLCADV